MYVLVRLHLDSEADCARTLRYNDAMATVRRISNMEHNFQLVVTRVYEEGDQELLEDEDESTSVDHLRSE